MSKTVRYVMGDEKGLLRWTQGDRASQMMKKFTDALDWVKRDYPVIYKLVPVSLSQVKRQMNREKAARRTRT